MIICNSDDLDVREKSYIGVLHQKYIDGIIFASSTLSEEDLEYMDRHHIPLVVLDSKTRGQGGCSVNPFRKMPRERSWRFNIYRMRDAAKIAHIAGPQELITAQERLKGYREMVEDRAWFEESLIVPGHFLDCRGKGGRPGLAGVPSRCGRHFPPVTI